MKEINWNDEKNIIIAFLITIIIVFLYLNLTPSSKSSVPSEPPCEPDYMGGCW